MITIIGISLIVIFVVILVYEFHNAKEIPPTEPFLHDDYDPKKDPTLDIIAQSPNAQTLINALNKLAMIDAGTGTIEIDDVLSAISTNPDG